MASVVTAQSHEKPPGLTFFILLGKKSSSGFGGTPISHTWMNNSTITVSYLDSLNAQLYCPWKRVALISIAFL